MHLQKSNMGISLSKSKARFTVSGRFFGSAPGTADYLIVAVLWIAAFIFFDQWFDMTLITLHASDLLDCIFTGKPLKFYSYVFERASEGKYISSLYDETKVAASYNIVVYLTMAAWELPIYALNHVVPIMNYSLFLEFWGRLAGMLMSCLCCSQITKLAYELMSDKNKAKWVGYFFISSPLIPYCVIIRNQLDIVSVLLVILALRKYFKKNLTAFSLIMAVAGCFKIVPFLIVIPLLLLAEKKILKLIGFISVSFSLYAASNILFLLADPAFKRTQELLAEDTGFSDYILKTVIPGGVSDTSVFLLLYFLICVIAYVAKPSEKEFPVYTVMLGFSALSEFFLFVKWHPQWLVLLLPFVTLMVFSLFDFELGFLLDIAGMLGFLVTSILIHLTKSVFTLSIFYALTFGRFAEQQIYSPIYMFFANNGLTTIVPSTLFFSGIVSLLLVAYLNIRSSASRKCRPFDNAFKESRSLFYARSAVILVYIVPPVLSYLSQPIR